MDIKIKLASGFLLAIAFVAPIQAEDKCTECYKSAQTALTSCIAKAKTEAAKTACNNDGAKASAACVKGACSDRIDK